MGSAAKEGESRIPVNRRDFRVHPLLSYARTSGMMIVNRVFQVTCVVRLTYGNSSLAGQMLQGPAINCFGYGRSDRQCSPVRASVRILPQTRTPAPKNQPLSSGQEVHSGSTRHDRRWQTPSAFLH